MRDVLLDGALDEVPESSKNLAQAQDQEQVIDFVPEHAHFDNSLPPDYSEIPPLSMEEIANLGSNDDISNIDLPDEIISQPITPEFNNIEQEELSSFTENSEMISEENRPVIEDQENEIEKIESRFTLAQLSGDEEVDPSLEAELSYERLVILMALRSQDENHAL